MKRLLALVGGVVSFSCFAGSTSLFTMPVIIVTPMTKNFGSVPAGASVTNAFVVENAGSGTLVGKATVPPPFKILSGGDYSLKRADAQVVTITYKPSGASIDERAVRFSGGGGAKAMVVGRLAPAPRRR